MVVDPTGVKVRVKFGDSRSNHSRDIRLPHFVRTTATTEADAETPYKFEASSKLLEFYAIIVLNHYSVNYNEVFSSKIAKHMT